jgi:hypothetical protein
MALDVLRMGMLAGVDSGCCPAHWVMKSDPKTQNFQGVLQALLETLDSP